MAVTTGDNYNAPVPNAGNGTTQTLYFEHAVTTATFASNGDRVNLRPLPRSARIVGFYLKSTDLDTATALTLTLRVSDGTTTHSLLSASTIGQAGGSATPEGNNESGMLFETDNGDYELQLVSPAAAGTPAAGTVSGFLQYVCRQGG